MSDQIKQIASRLKALRENSGFSAESMAESGGISTELYYEYEAGSVDIPVGFLYEAAQKFNVELTALLTGDEPKIQNFTLVRKGEGVEVERKQAYHYESLAYNFMNKRGEPFLVTIEPKAKDERVVQSSHPGQEFNYMVQGNLKLYLGDKEIILNEGDSLYFDSNLPHGMTALDDKPAKMLAIIMK